MKFGNPKENIPKNNFLTIPVGVDGIGAEEHPTMKTMEKNDEVYDRVRKAVLETNKPETEKLPRQKNIFKYLINLLSNKSKTSKPKRQKLSARIKHKLANWWRKETTNDSADLIKFVLIHGLLGAPALLMLLTISPVDFVLLNIIRDYAWITLLVYIIGAGCIYYLFLDINKALRETWARTKRGKNL